MADARQRRQELGEGLSDRPVAEDRLVAGMVDDVGELVCEQPHIERMEDPAAAGNTEVELQMVVGVPAEASDPRVRGNTERIERPTELATPGCPPAVGATAGAAGQTGHDLLARRELLGSFQEVRERQRPLLHQPVHARSPLPTT